MLKRFYPSKMADSAYDIPYSRFYEKGYRGIIFDIDNTLVMHDADATPQAIALLHSLKEQGFQLCILSNNGEERVNRFNEEIGAMTISKAGKPSRKGYRRAMEQMGTDVGHTLFVGDQLFTDVWGARRCGIYSILTKPIDPKEEIQIRLKRKLEWIVLRSYRRSQERKKKR